MLYKVNKFSLCKTQISALSGRMHIDKQGAVMVC